MSDWDSKLDPLLLPEAGADRCEERFEIYKLCVEMADRISARRQAANAFFLTLNTALIAIAPIFDADVVGLILPMAGIAICMLWIRGIKSYRDLNRGKFAVITRLEKTLGAAPYSAEWDFLGRGEDATKYYRFSEVKKWIPIVFIALYCVATLVSIMALKP